MAEVLDSLLATAALVCGYAAAPLLALWLGILLHELAHAAVARLVGARILQGFVGGGRHVLPVRLFGVRWQLRPLPTHGAVWIHLRMRSCWRLRLIAVHLAGPLASTGVAAGFAAWWMAAPPPDAAVQAQFFWLAAQQAALTGAMGASVLAAFVAWLPLQMVVAGAAVPSDVRSAWQLLSAGCERLAALAAAHQEQAAVAQAWLSFLDGRHEDALRQHRAVAASVPLGFEATFNEALFAWPVEGAVAALALVDRAEAGFAAWRRDQEQQLGQQAAPRDAEKQLRRYAREFGKLLLVQRAFLGAVSGRDDLLAEAGKASDEMLRTFRRDAAVLRTAGFVDLHRGRIAEGMRRLWQAWRSAEPVWLRALTALYLAFGHSLRDRHGEASRWLRKARRLHPECPLLPEYEARIRAATAGGVAAGQPAAR